MMNQATFTAITAAHKESERLEKKYIDILRSDKSTLKEVHDACRELGRVGGNASIEPLAAWLNGDERISHMARYGLETNPDPKVNEVLRDALGKVKGKNLMGIILSLGVRKDEQAVEAIAQHLNSDDKHLSATAARALGSIGSQAAFAALRDALRSGQSGDKLALFEGVLRCAEAFADNGNKDQALRIYSRLQEMDTPHQVKTGAKQAAERLG